MHITMQRNRQKSLSFGHAVRNIYMAKIVSGTARQRNAISSTLFLPCDLVSYASSTYRDSVKEHSKPSAQDGDDGKRPAHEIADHLHEITSG